MKRLAAIIRSMTPLERRKPELLKAKRKFRVAKGAGVVAASDAQLGEYFLCCEGMPRLLFVENETNNERKVDGAQRPAPQT